MRFTVQRSATEFPVIERLRSVINGIRVTGQMTDTEILLAAIRAIPHVKTRVDEAGKVWVRVEPLGRWLRELMTHDTGEVY